MKTPKVTALCIVLSLTVTTLSAPIQDVAKRFEAKSVVYTGGPYKNEVFNYRLLRPAKIEKGKRYPLVVFLHGAGERGGENVNQLKYLPDWLSSDDMRAKYPCYILAPQCRRNEKWVDSPWGAIESTPLGKPSHQMRVAMQALDKTLRDEQESIDTTRVYLTGLSMGGYGTWDLAMRRPTTFAAIAPICGGGDEREAKRITRLPTWVWHGDKDGAVPVERSRNMIKALQDAGGKPKYTELKGAGHNVWTPAYKNKDGVLPWLFKQRRSK